MGQLIDAVLTPTPNPSRWAFTRHFAKVSSHAFSIKFERDADYVDAYYVARAGHDISGAATVRCL